MNTQIESPADPGSPATTPRTKSRWVAAALAGFVVIAVAVTVLVLTRDDGTTQADASQRIAATQAGCEQWAGSGASTDASMPDAGWCGDMSSWMNDQVVDDTTMGSMMWESPQAMTARCQDWAATDGGASSAGWCEQMATWMSQHMDNWDDRQDWDNHMGDGHWDDGMMRS